MTERLYIRWMIRRDMPEVLAIEAESFEFPWTEKDFARCLRTPTIGMVAERAGEIVGYMIYKLHKRRLDVLKLAVAPGHRESGVGSQLIERLKRKLSPNRRDHLVFRVSERNVAAQVWLRSRGFRWVATLRVSCEGVEEDRYVMRYRCCSDERWLPRNRVSKHFVTGTQ